MANNEWSTPSKYIESARKAMGSIDTDPASNETAQKLVKAEVYYTQKTNGLNKSWAGNVWLNPPYGRGETVKFCSLLIEQFNNGDTDQAIVLTNNVTDVNWFAETIETVASAYCFPDHRIQFVAPEGTKVSSNAQGQVFSYIGGNPSAFMEEFKQYGLCLTPKQVKDQLNGKWSALNFIKHHQKHPEIYIMFKGFSLEMANKREYYSAKSIFHRIRWESAISEKG